MRARWLAAGFVFGVFWFASVEARQRALAELSLMEAVMREPGFGREVHTIPVPAGWSVEQAWDVIMRGEKLPEGVEIRWANVDENGRLVG